MNKLSQLAIIALACYGQSTLTMNNDMLAISEANNTQIVERIEKFNNLKLYKSDKDGHYYLTDTSQTTTLETRAELYLHLRDNIANIQSTNSELFNQVSRLLIATKTNGGIDSNCILSIVKHAGMNKARHILDLARYENSKLNRLPIVIFHTNIMHILENKNYQQ